jgi:cyclic dehypoxanthinyl futalosine synthase
MKTTATMMFGSIEGPEHIVEHLEAVRKLQDKTGGFTAFIPWSFQPGNTALGEQSGEVEKRGSEKPRRKKTSALPDFRTSALHSATAVDYLRVLALSRVYLDNVPNIQASWVTQGLKMAQLALRFGANDFGSTMLEENVVAAAGVKYRVSIQDILHAIRTAGFKPVQRDMYYNTINDKFQNTHNKSILRR